MSEYTMYSIINTDDILKTCENLTELGITSVLLPDFHHPLYKFDNVNKLAARWKDLSYKDQWLIFMSDKKPCREIDLFDKSVYLMIDEDPNRWFLGMYTLKDTCEYLFSDKPWGDMCDSDPQNDLDRIERSKSINKTEIKFMEDFYQLPHSEFANFLRMGKAYNFLESVGIPAIEMLCDWLFYYPKECEGRCILWKEYGKFVD
jgi:hypothetical protein